MVTQLGVRRLDSEMREIILDMGQGCTEAALDIIGENLLVEISRASSQMWTTMKY